MTKILIDAALDKMADNARELGLDYEQPVPVKTYCGGKPNYCIPEQPAPAQLPPNCGTGYCSCIECLKGQP